MRLDFHFCWLQVAMVVVLRAADGELTTEPISELSKRRRRRRRTTSGTNLRHRQQARGHGSLRENGHSRLPTINFGEGGERKEPPAGVSKDDFRMDNNAVTWRDRLFPPSEFPTTSPSETPSRIPSDAPSPKPTETPSK